MYNTIKCCKVEKLSEKIDKIIMKRYNRAEQLNENISDTLQRLFIKQDLLLNKYDRKVQFIKDNYGEDVT